MTARSNLAVVELRQRRPAEPIDIVRMATLVAEIERLRHDYCPMPDGVMAQLTEARCALVAAVMAAPARSMTELAAKLHMLAATNSDDDSFHPALFDDLATVTEDAEAIWKTEFAPGRKVTS